MRSTRFGGRLAPAMVVAALAAVACVGGVATAGPDATSSAITKKKVKKVSKKVANKEITARAPTLTVGNSEKVDNLDAAQITPATSVDTTGQPDLDLTGDFQTVLTTTLTTAASGRVLATAAVELNSTGGNDDNGVCRIDIAGGQSLNFITDIPDSSVDRQSLAVVYGPSLAAGTHTIQLQCRDNGGDVEVERAALIASAHS